MRQGSPGDTGGTEGWSWQRHYKKREEVADRRVPDIDTYW
jgi:hypothetical protein